MGTWGKGSFENDSAADFMNEVIQDGDFALREAFDVVLDVDTDDLVAEEGMRAIAAAEILAAVLTGDTSKITDAGLRTWIQNANKTSLANLRSLASEALDRILAPQSELPELWEETEDDGAWLADVQRLRSSLS